MFALYTTTNDACAPTPRANARSQNTNDHTRQTPCRAPNTPSRTHDEANPNTPTSFPHMHSLFISVETLPMLGKPKYSWAVRTEADYDEIKRNLHTHQELKPLVHVSKHESCVIFLYKGQEEQTLVLMPGAKCYQMPCQVKPKTKQDTLYVFTYA